MLPNGPISIQKVIEFEWPKRAPEFLLRGVTPESFCDTRASTDGRFVDQGSKQLIMSFHSLLVRGKSLNLLVDTCVGNHKERPALAEWHLQNRPYLRRLAEAGVKPDDIDLVCCTHLHADHVGWNTQLDDGRWVPTFPKAKYLFAADEVEYWQTFHDADPDNPFKNSWSDSVLPILEAGQAELVANDYDIGQGLQLQAAPGHTPGNVVIRLGNAKQRALLCGDAIHHPVQIEKPAWSSNFCLDPVQSAKTRGNLLEDIADTGTLLMGAHFAGPGAVRIVSENDGFFYT